jgi:hypothetical protein
MTQPWRVTNIYPLVVTTVSRKVFDVLGRLVAVAAVVVGVVLSFQLFAESYAGGIKSLIVSAGVAALAGGLLYLIGLDRWKGRRATIARAAGWLLFTVAFLLPNSLQGIMLFGSLLAAPAVPEWGKAVSPGSQGPSAASKIG